MQIVTHMGAQCTDGERLLRVLLRNGDKLAGHGVAVPGHGRYRRLLRETVQELAGAAPPAGTRDVLLDAILEQDGVQRLVLSNPAFICPPALIFEGGVFYGRAGPKLQTLRQLFPDDALEIHLALRNPATFLPAVFTQVTGQSFDQFMGGLDPLAVRWSDPVDRIREAVPDARLVVWCNEDTALIWSAVLRSLAGLPGSIPLEGDDDLLATIMSPEGLTRYRAYLASHPPHSDPQLRKIISAFLDKYALPEEIEEAIDLPGWDQPLADRLTDAYEADVERIAGRGDVTFLAP